MFTWILRCLSTAGLVKGKTIRIDATTIRQTLPEAAEQLEAMAAATDRAVAVIDEIAADKGDHSRTTVHDLETMEIRTYISEPERGPQSAA